MASLTQWTWVWVSSGSWWWTGRPGVLQSMGSQRVRHDWTTELNWTECMCFDATLFVLLSLSPAVSPSLFSKPVSLSLPCASVSQYHLSRFHTCASLCGICFSSSDLRHSAQQALGSCLRWDACCKSSWAPVLLTSRLSIRDSQDPLLKLISYIS